MAGFHTLHASTKLSFHTRMPALLQKFNYQNIVLADGVDAEQVGVINNAGDTRYFPWLGFIERQTARTLPGAASVRLEIHGYSVGDGYCDPWQPIRQGMHVRGCLVSEGVYAIVENGIPRVI